MRRLQGYMKRVRGQREIDKTDGELRKAQQRLAVLNPQLAEEVAAVRAKVSGVVWGDQAAIADGWKWEEG